MAFRSVTGPSPLLGSGSTPVNAASQQLITGSGSAPVNPASQQLITGTSSAPISAASQKLITGSSSLPINAASQQLIKSERGMLKMSDDNVMMKQIIALHSHDGREVSTRPLLRLIEDILSRATVQVDPALLTTQGHADIEDKTLQGNISAMLDVLSFTIDQIFCEIACNCRTLAGADGHASTIAVFNKIASYDWDAKLVLSMAAFALHYGEFWLLAQIYSTNSLAKAMAILKQVPVVLEHSGMMKSRFDALNNLIRVMMDVTRCVVEFKEVPSTFISEDTPVFTAAKAHIPTAVYWTIRSIIVCAAQITALTTMGHEYAVSTTEAWEISTMAHKLEQILEHLRKLLAACYQYIEDKLHVLLYQRLLDLFETSQIDNMRILKSLLYARDDVQLILDEYAKRLNVKFDAVRGDNTRYSKAVTYSKDDILPLVDGSSKRRVSLDVLRRKNVLLLISDLDIFQEELAILEQIYNDSRLHPTRPESNYELVWVPIVDPALMQTESTQKKFESLQATVPWYTVQHPSQIEKHVIRFIKEVWHFRNRPILVVLDPVGKVVSPNAIHMMWIWGSDAFPFTSYREEERWRGETWRLDLLVDRIDPVIFNWIESGKYIFIYGGDDLAWVRRFTTAARSVAAAARIPLEIMYVGKSTKREQVRRAVAAIIGEKLSSAWQDPAMIWFFWTRLESMLFSKIQLGKADDHDPMMHEIKKLISYDREGGWAVLSKGNDVIVNGHGTTVLGTLVDYDLWKENVPVKGFDISFKEYHDKLHGDAHPCTRFEFPTTVGRIPERIKCPECHRGMEKFTTFRCCHDEGTPDYSTIYS